MITGILMLRWVMALLVIITLIIAMAVLLQYLKRKHIGLAVVDSCQKMKIIDIMHVDSKNKIVKLQDSNKVITMLIGSNSFLIDKENIEKKEKND